ncbi:hypothetical protein OE88DRAFT_1031641 [Heliocybe sulcata]|uniref:Uncharacterized protein n=1 Tax=Heliocybe sulcata TaxID=5364 RepID=A0A5C3NC94_9AGAM|nr:hypothetical protein OE88DRAFT_1031641 [Heliocybe sulcata]
MPTSWRLFIAPRLHTNFSPPSTTNVARTYSHSSFSSETIVYLASMISSSSSKAVFPRLKKLLKTLDLGANAGRAFCGPAWIIRGIAKQRSQLGWGHCIKEEDMFSKRWVGRVFESWLGSRGVAQNAAEGDCESSLECRERRGVFYALLSGGWQWWLTVDWQARRDHPSQPPSVVADAIDETAIIEILGDQGVCRSASRDRIGMLGPWRT